MELPIDETKLHHPFDRHVFAVFALLNLVVFALALFVVMQGSDWLAARPILAEYAPRIRGFLVAALLALPAITLLRNTRYAEIEGNSIRISSSEFSMLDSILRRHCERLGIERVPELFFSDTAINEPARAYTSWKREFIVLNAKYLQPNLEEMRDVYEFFLGRELGRLRLLHASWQYELLLSYVQKIPYLRNPMLHVFTYSEDRYGAALAPEGIRGLLIIPASRLMLPSVNIQQYLEQVNPYRGIWTKLAHFQTETPQIAHRINALIEAGLWKAPTSMEPGSQANTSPRRSLEKRTG